MIADAPDKVQHMHPPASSRMVTSVCRCEGALILNCMNPNTTTTPLPLEDWPVDAPISTPSIPTCSMCVGMQVQGNSLLYRASMLFYVPAAAHIRASC
jgi:hypothetical protein